MVHPLFGLFAEPASTVLVTADPERVSEIEKLAEQFNFIVARIGTTGGTRLEIAVDGDVVHFSVSCGTARTLVEFA